MTGSSGRQGIGILREPSGSENEVCSVLVCENDPVMRSTLHDLLDSVPAMNVVGVAADAEEAAELAERLHPDVALLDVRMPKGGGPRAARLINGRCPDVRLVAFTAYADSAVVIAMLRAGVSDYLVKGVDDDKLVEALRRSGRGVIGLSRLELSELVFDLVDLIERPGERVDTIWASGGAATA